MATQAGLVRDQNLNVHLKAGAPALKTTNKQQKNGGLGARKVLGDISNSRRPTTFQPPNKLGPKNMIPVAEDVVPAKSKSSVGSKTKALTKGAGRKALGDLTNSVKHANWESKKTHAKKLNAVVEEPFPCDSEGIGEHLLHDHGACIKAKEKAKAMDMMHFLKEYGLDNSVQTSPPGNPPLSAKMKLESTIKFDEMKELFKLQHEDKSQFDKYEAFGEALCASPVSPPRFQWDDDMILSLKPSSCIWYSSCKMVFIHDGISITIK